MSYDHMNKKIEQLRAEVGEILAEAEAIDREEDDAFGVDHRGDEVPAELARRETRIAKMREAMEAIEAEAEERAGAKQPSKAERAGADQDEITQEFETGKRQGDTARKGPAQLHRSRVADHEDRRCLVPLLLQRTGRRRREVPSRPRRCSHPASH